MPPTRPLAACSLALLVVGAGCGGDAGAHDAGTDGPPIDPSCARDREPTARFSVVAEPGASARLGSQVGGQLLAFPRPRLEATLLAEGSCWFVGARPALCEPACAGAQVCDVDGRCVDYPEPLPAGAFTVTGTTPPVTLTPRAGNGYYADQGYPGLFRADDVLTLTLAGDGVVAALAATVRGVPPLALPTTQLVAREHAAMDVAWQPIAAPADAEVLVHFDSDHHGVRAYVECVAPAAAGQLTIPAALLDRLILAGETGIGTFIENAWIEVHHQARLETPRGCAVLESYADQFVHVETVRAP